MILLCLMKSVVGVRQEDHGTKLVSLQKQDPNLAECGQKWPKEQSLTCVLLYSK